MKILEKKQTRVTFSIPEDTHSKMQDIARWEGKLLKNSISEAISEYLKTYSKDGALSSGEMKIILNMISSGLNKYEISRMTNISLDILEHLFSEKNNDLQYRKIQEKQKTISIPLNNDVYENIKTIAHSKGVLIKNVITGALLKYIKEKKIDLEPDQKKMVLKIFESGVKAEKISKCTRIPLRTVEVILKEKIGKK